MRAQKGSGGWILTPKNQVVTKAIMAANIVKRSGIATYTLTDILKFSEGKQFWLGTNKIMTNNPLEAAVQKKI
jgi:hypothetical protein